MIEHKRKIDDFLALSWLIFTGPVTYDCVCACARVSVQGCGGLLLFTNDVELMI